MGLAIIIDGVDFSNKRRGKINTEYTDTKSIKIKTLNVDKTFVQLRTKFIPPYGADRSVTWSVVDGGNFASIDATGKLTIVADTFNQKVKVRSMLNANSSIKDELSIYITYEYDDDHIIQFESNWVKEQMLKLLKLTEVGEITVGQAKAWTGNFGNAFYNKKVDNFGFKELRFFSYKLYDRGISRVPVTSLYIPKGLNVVPATTCNYCQVLSELNLADALEVGEPDGTGGTFHNTALSNVDFHNIKKMYYSFRLCNFVNVVLPNTIEIFVESFTINSSLRTFKIEDGGTKPLTVNSTFKELPSLELVDLPSNLVALGSEMFYNSAKNSITFVCRAVTPPSGLDGLGFRRNLVAIYVPDESVDTYKATAGWSAQSDKILPLSQYVEK